MRESRKSRIKVFLFTLGWAGTLTMVCITANQGRGWSAAVQGFFLAAWTLLLVEEVAWGDEA